MIWLTVSGEDLCPFAGRKPGFPGSVKHPSFVVPQSLSPQLDARNYWHHRDGFLRASGTMLDWLSCVMKKLKEEQAMDRDATRQRTKADMETDFLPEASSGTLSQADRRMVNAAEYIAYHLGQMDKKLDRLIVLLEASAQTKS